VPSIDVQKLEQHMPARSTAVCSHKYDQATYSLTQGSHMVMDGVDGNMAYLLGCRRCRHMPPAKGTCTTVLRHCKVPPLPDALSPLIMRAGAPAIIMRMIRQLPELDDGEGQQEEGARQQALITVT